MPRGEFGLCNTRLQPSDGNLSMSAPAEAVFCFLIFEGSSESLATEHMSDVSTHFARNTNASGFHVEPCSMLYPPHYKTAFASSDFSMPSLHGPALRLACHASCMAD
jgi:hypothetical protein